MPTAKRARFDIALGDRKQRKRARRDPLVRRGIFDRPYLVRIGSASTNVALGGYVDLVGNYLREQGIDEGFSFEARRFNIFLTSKIADYVRLTSELEFEHGTEEIALETALVDLLLHHAINIRGGILLVPLGKFNIAHDSPIYDVIDRPLVSTRIIPATLSEIGFGIFGAFYPGGRHKLTYEVYAVNGLADGVIAAEGTRIAQGKSPTTFEEDNNGSPALTARLAYTMPRLGKLRWELGASSYHGIYNRHSIEGDQVQQVKWLHLFAWDSELEYGPLLLRGEVAYAHVELPGGLTDLHASDQLGLYVETSYRIFQRALWILRQAALIAIVRLDHVDLNLNKRSTGEAMGDSETRLTLGLSFRPAPTTSFRVGYRHSWLKDPLNNRTRAGGVQMGLATYF